MSSYEKFIMDMDQLGMTQKFAAGVDLTENGQAMDAIRQVGPGSHYLGCEHTLANFQTAFYASPLTDNNSYEQWLAEGEKRIEQRGNELVRRLLDSATKRRISTRPSTKRCSPLCARKRIRCPTPSPEGSPTQAGLKWPTLFTRKSGAARLAGRTESDGCVETSPSVRFANVSPTRGEIERAREPLPLVGEAPAKRAEGEVSLDRKMTLPA